MELFYNVFLLFCKALTAINRMIIAWLKWHFRLCTTICTNCNVHFSGCFDGILAACAAILATHWLVLESLFSIEFLFSCGKNEFCPTVLAY